MDNLSEYLLKSGVALALLYSYYWLLLRKDTHFTTNRVVLITSILVSLTLPLVNFTFFSSIQPVLPQLTINFDEIPVSTGNVADTIIPDARRTWGFWNWAALVYVAGCVLVLTRLIYQAIYLHAVSRISKTISYDKVTIVLMEKDMIPFSYFNKIFIPKVQFNDTSIQNIVEHERSHLHQYHFIDIIITQILTIIQWFNPFAWFIERSVKEIHEFLADKSVLSSGYNQGRYQALLVNQAMGGPVFTITNQFNQSLIKKRIIMMTKMKSPRMAKLKAFLLVPLAALLMMAFAKPEAGLKELNTNVVSNSKEDIKISGKVTDFTTGTPLPGIAIVIKGTTTGTITDVEGNYTILVPDDEAVLVFSHVGYKTQVHPVKGNTLINVLMEQEVLNIDFSKGNSLVASEKPRSPEKPSGDMYVVIEEPPTYPGGTDALQKFIIDNLKYPEDARTEKISGKVLVNFIIDRQGNLTDAKVMRGVTPSLDEEALRVTKLITGWRPAHQNGKAVSYRVIMPVIFRLK